jgi:ankyrin repeat protein
MAFQLRNAIMEKDSQRLKEILEKEHLNLNELVNGYTPLGLAVYLDFFEGVKTLLDHRTSLQKEIESQPDPNVQSYIMDLYHWKGTEAPLHTVCRRKGQDGSWLNNHRIARLLLDHGALTSVTDSSNVTPLIYAVHNQDLFMVELLLQYGADIQQHNSSGGHVKVISAVHKAIEQSPKNVKIFDLLLAYMIRRGLQSVPIDRDGNTTLHVTSKYGMTSLVHCMLEYCSCITGRVDEQALNKNLETPLVVAVSFLKVTVANVLISHGRQLSHKPTSFHSPLFRAFKMTLDDGRHDEAMDHRFPVLPHSQKVYRQKLFIDLCESLVHAGIPLKTESWLNYGFRDLEQRHQQSTAV